MLQQYVIEKKLFEIAQTINYTISKKTKSLLEEGIGLYTGQSGVLLFLAYYSKYINKKFRHIYNDYANLYFENLSSNFEPSYSFCDGISGVLFILNHLKEKNLLDIDIREAEEYFDNYLTLQIENCIKTNNNDFMHGMIGVGLYYLKRHDQKSIVNLELIINHLISSSILQDHKIKWSFKEFNEKTTFNICLSHGISSIIIFLCQLYLHPIGIHYSEKMKYLITGAINYILDQEIEKEQYGCYFPLMSLENSNSLFRTRLAWCYGDLGIAVALYQAGKTLNNNNWQQKALEVFQFSIQRRNLRENSVLDAGICHGTSGIAEIFHWIYSKTKSKDFLTTAQYWTYETLRMARFQDGLAGYKYFTYKNKIVWETSYNFLHGISGIGLSLISSLNFLNPFSEWNEILLLK